MKTKTVTAKKEGQKRGLSAARKTQALTEPALLQAAAHTSGLMVAIDDLVTGKVTPEATQTEATQTQASEVAAEPTAPDSSAVECTSEAAASTESAPAEGDGNDANSAPVAETISKSIESLPRAGLVESPLAQRMRAEAAQRGGRKTRASHRGLGAEFEAADNRVMALQAQFEEAKAQIKGSEELEVVAAKISEVRAEIRASRGAKVEGVETFNAAILEAREALKAAKRAKGDFLAENGVGAAVAEEGGPSLRQRLKALRAEKEALLEAGGGEGLAKIRAELKAAKIERKSACEKATAAREETTPEVAPELDSQAQDDARDSAQGGQQ